MRNHHNISVRSGVTVPAHSVTCHMVPDLNSAVLLAVDARQAWRAEVEATVQEWINENIVEESA